MVLDIRLRVAKDPDPIRDNDVLHRNCKCRNLETSSKLPNKSSWWANV